MDAPDELWLGGVDPEVHVRATKLLRAGKRARAETPRAQEREHPLGSRAQHGHDDVTGDEPCPLEAGSGPCRLVRDVSERETGATALVRDSSKCLVVWSCSRELFDHVGGEVEVCGRLQLGLTRSEVSLEPLGCLLCNRLERARFLEEVTRAGDHHQLVRAAHQRLRLAVQRQHLWIGASDDQKRRSRHP